MTLLGLEHRFWMASDPNNVAVSSLSHALRLDDSLGQLTVARKTEESQESNIVSDVLTSGGVQYRHRNSDIVTSRVAGKAEKHFVEVRVSLV